MLVHFTEDGTVHDGPEVGCVKCRRFKQKEETRLHSWTKGHVGGKLSAAQRDGTVERPNKACVACGKVLHKKTATGLCRDCWTQHQKMGAVLIVKTCACGQVLSPRNQTGMCRKCLKIKVIDANIRMCTQRKKAVAAETRRPDSNSQ